MISKLWSRSYSLEVGIVRKGRMRSQFSIVLVIRKLIEVDINNNDDDDYHNDIADDNEYFLEIEEIYFYYIM